jgi:hypothetical protein
MEFSGVTVCNLVWLKSLSLNGNKIRQVYALDICCYITKLTKARHPTPDLHFSFRKTYWKTARPFRTYPCMTTRSRWTIFKCSMIVLLCDVILLWSCDPWSKCMEKAPTKHGKTLSSTHHRQRFSIDIVCHFGCLCHNHLGRLPHL